MHITNPKLQSVWPPVWKRYPGLSILYDDAGAAELSGIESLQAVSSAGHHQQPLYGRLSLVAGEIESATRRDGLGLCRLPRHTYHVTLCDGVNHGTRTHIHPDLRWEVEQTLDELPDSLLWATTVMRLVQDPEIAWAVWSHPIEFRLEALRVWGLVLAAELRPADDRSMAAKAKHETSRSELVARLNARMGVQTQQWRPHVTLGYFANEESATHARFHVLPQWQDFVRERTEGLSVTFRSASVYGFTDMVSFWRLVH